MSQRDLTVSCLDQFANGYLEIESMSGTLLAQVGMFVPDIVAGKIDELLDKYQAIGLADIMMLTVGMEKWVRTMIIGEFHRGTVSLILNCSTGRE